MLAAAALKLPSVPTLLLSGCRRRSGFPGAGDGNDSLIAAVRVDLVPAVITAAVNG